MCHSSASLIDINYIFYFTLKHSIWLKVCEHLNITPIMWVFPKLLAQNRKHTYTVALYWNWRAQACQTWSTWQCTCAENEVHKDMVCQELEWPRQSPDLNTFGMNLTMDCTPGLLSRHQCLTSLILSWLNPHNHSPKYSGKSSQKSGGGYNRKGGTKSGMGC